jgi:hypothetical protein
MQNAKCKMQTEFKMQTAFASSRLGERRGDSQPVVAKRAGFAF